MSDEINIYCDESCHLEHDNQGIMVLGAVWCGASEVLKVFQRIREIKQEHNLDKFFEIKWTKVSKGQWPFYKDILDYFFDNNDLHFRCLVVTDKTKLRHNEFGQDHDTFYYKMYFEMLKLIINPSHKFNIYLDIKDSLSARKTNKLHRVLSNNLYDFDRSIIKRIQNVRSHEVELIQLADFLIGILAYANRKLTTSEAKIDLVKHMRKKSGYALTKSTLLKEEKVNVFCWRPRENV